jgi:hypothetical protein
MLETLFQGKMAFTLGTHTRWNELPTCCHLRRKTKKSLACENIATHDSRLQFWYCGILWHLILLNSLVFTSIYNIFEYVWSSHRLWERRSVRIPEDWRMGRNGDNMWQPSRSLSMSWAWMIWMSELPGPKPTFWWATSARAPLCLLPKEFETSGITGIRLDWVGIALVIEVWQLPLVSQTDVYKSTWGWRRNLDFACCQVEVCAYREGFERLKFMLCSSQILRYCTKFLFSLDVETFSAHIFASWSWVSCEETQAQQRSGVLLRSISEEKLGGSRYAWHPLHLHPGATRSRASDVAGRPRPFFRSFISWANDPRLNIKYH